MIWAFEDFVLDTALLEFRRGDEVVAMEPQVFEVLCYLVERRNRVVSKEELLDNVWGSRFVSESALTSRIKSVRQAVGDNGRDQRVIRTFHGRGYRFVLAVEERPGSPVVSNEAAVGISDPPIDRAGPPLAVDQEFPFVGRGGLIDEAIAAAATVVDGPRALLLGGEPGVGKSRLALEIAARVAEIHGHIVIGGRCEQYLASSLQPWLEALTWYVTAADPEGLQTDTIGIVDRLRRVLPILDQRLGSTTPAGDFVGDEYEVVDGIVTFIERISKARPVVIVLDDVHWAGGATRAVASLLMRRSVARVQLILTFRTTIDDLDVATGEWLDALEQAGATREEITGLSATDIDELVDSSLGEAGRAHALRIWERSGGHSLFAVELIRDLVDGGAGEGMPSTVALLVQRRLAKLDPKVASLVVAGAAFGQEFELGLVAAVTDLSEDEALDAVEGAVGAQLLHEAPDRVDWYRFSHQLVPAAALESMSRSRRVRLHAKVADHLEQRHASGVEIAHHLIEAAAVLDPYDVVHRVREVSENAVRVHQYDRAVELLERVSKLDIDARLRAEVLAEFGAACNLAGQQPRALSGLTHAADVARRNGWDDMLAAAALGLWGQSPFRASRDRMVIPLLDEAIGRSEGLDDRTRARLLAKRAAFNLFSGPMDERDRLSAEALELVGSAGTAERLEVLEARWMAIASPSRLPEIVELDIELATLRRDLGALSTDACAPEISIYWRALGDELRMIAAELRDDPRQRRDVDQWRSAALAGGFALYEGDVDTAREQADRALPLGKEPWGEAGDVVHALVHLVADAIDRSHAEETVENWRRVSELVPSDPMRATRAWAEALWGDRDVAMELIDLVVPRIDLLAENFMGGFGLIGLAEATLVLERRDVVPRLIEVLTPLEGQMLGHPWAPSFAAADALARLHSMVGNEPASAMSAERARQLYEQLGATSFRERLEVALS